MSTTVAERLRLRLDRIRDDGGTQPRSMIDESVVEDYALVARNGALPAVTVFYDGSDYWLADGFHRLAACKRAKLAEIEAEICQGTRRDAILYSVGTNTTHGLRRTNDDKRRAVTTLLNDPEWRKWSDNEIAKRCVVSQPFVSKVRSEIKPSYNGYKMDEPKVAEEARMATRGGTTYTVNTSKIGGSQKAAKKEPTIPPEDDEEDIEDQEETESHESETDIEDEPQADDEDDPEPILFECPVCEREFHGEVWHCRRCQTHSVAADVRCQHCGARKDGETAGARPTSPTTKPPALRPTTSTSGKLPDILLRLSSVQSLLGDLEPFEFSFFSTLPPGQAREAGVSAENIHAITGRLVEFLKGRYAG